MYININIVCAIYNLGSRIYRRLIIKLSVAFANELSGFKSIGKRLKKKTIH